MSETAYREALLHADRPGAGPAGNCVLATGSLPAWLVAFISLRHETRRHLILRGIEHYLPLYQGNRKRRDGSRRTLDLQLFPGYILVCIKRTKRVGALEVPGVLTIVGGKGREPIPLPEAEIDALRSGLHLRRTESHPLLTIGQRAHRVRCSHGNGGTVVSGKNSLRIALSLDAVR